MVNRNIRSVINVCVAWIIFLQLIHKAWVWLDGRPCSFHSTEGFIKGHLLLGHEETDDNRSRAGHSSITVDQHHSILKNMQNKDFRHTHTHTHISLTIFLSSTHTCWLASFMNSKHSGKYEVMSVSGISIMVTVL